MNGTTNEMAVESTGWSSFERTTTDRAPTSSPTTMATTTASVKSPAAPQKEKAPAVAAIAVRSRTRAVASFTRPSPSRMVSSRGGRPNRLPIEVAATASGGLITAPRAIPAARERPGRMVESTTPITTADTSTSPTDSRLLGPRLRRKSVTGMLTAAAYSRGGSTTVRIHSSSIVGCSMPGIRLHSAPMTTTTPGRRCPGGTRTPRPPR